MGWTDDPDEEGLIEENPGVFIAIAILGIVIVTIMATVGIEYDPGWFEGQNIISSMGVIFLLIFIPAIAISTLTGRSDLVKWEAIFLIAAVAMVYLGNNFDILGTFEAKFSSWAGIDWDVKDLISVVLILAIIATAISAAFGKGVSIGSAVVLGICIVALWGVNSGLTADDFFSKLGSAIQSGTSGMIGADLGAGIGVGLVGAATGAVIGTAVFPGLGTLGGAVVGFLGGMGGYVIGDNYLW